MSCNSLFQRLSSFRARALLAQLCSWYLGWWSTGARDCAGAKQQQTGNAVSYEQCAVACHIDGASAWAHRRLPDHQWGRGSLALVHKCTGAVRALSRCHAVAASLDPRCHPHTATQLAALPIQQIRFLFVQELVSVDNRTRALNHTPQKQAPTSCFAHTCLYKHFRCAHVNCGEQRAALHPQSSKAARSASELPAGSAPGHATEPAQHGLPSCGRGTLLVKWGWGGVPHCSHSCGACPQKRPARFLLAE